MSGRDNKGFSLVEMLATVAILSIAGSIIFGFVMAASRFYSNAKRDINLQSEAQITLNWLNDALSGVEYGLTKGTDDAGNPKIEIYNSGSIYALTYNASAQTLYCDEYVLAHDGSLQQVSPGVENILAEYVTGFDVNLDNATADAPKAVVSIVLTKDEKQVSMERTIALRNNIKVNGTVSEIYAGNGVNASVATAVSVYPETSYLSKGGRAQFSARVSGIGFPSQTVTWQIADRTGLKDGTQIDSSTGVLVIAPDETAGNFRVMATSIATNAEGNTVSSGAECGIVNIVNVTSVSITNIPVEKQEVGTVFKLNAIVNGSNMGTVDTGVIWSVVTNKSGLSVNSEGTVTLGMNLYNEFPTTTDKDNAYVIVRATSVADPTKYADATIYLKFSNVELNFDHLTYTANRNGYIDLGKSLITSGVASSDMRLLWTLKDADGIRDKVSLDGSLGLLTVSKNIDYTKSYTLNIEVTMIITGTGEIADTASVKVIIPKVEIDYSEKTREILMGTSDNIAFTVTGLNPDKGDILVSSTPAVRNTLLYIQDNAVVASLGTNIKREQFLANVYLAGHSDITDSATILVKQNEYSDDSQNYVTNVEDVFMYVPVPGIDTDAPSEDDVKNSSTSTYIQVDGTKVYYSFDNARNRFKIRMGTSGAWYFYKKIAGTDICWYRGNTDLSNETAFYAPTPVSNTFPIGKFTPVNGTIYSTADLTYRGTAIKYRRMSIADLCDTTATGYIYQVYDPFTQSWYQYNELRDYWQTTDYENKAVKGNADASSQDLLASNAIDGNESSRWASATSDPQYITIDLGSVWRLGEVKLLWETARSSHYDLEVSVDGTNWVNIGTCYNDSYTDRTSEEYACNQYGRYVRMYSYSRNSEHGNSIWEFYVWSAGADTDYNANDYPIYIPVPGNDDANAPTLSQAQAGFVLNVGGKTINYSYADGRYLSEIEGTDYKYTYINTNDSIDWYRVSGGSLYIPNPVGYEYQSVAGRSYKQHTQTIGTDPANSETITFRRYEINEYTAQTKYVYYATGDGGNTWYRYNETLNKWTDAAEESDTTINKALNTTVSATSNPQDAKKSVDGSMSTRWASSPTNDVYYTLDLGSIQRLHQIKLVWERARAITYEVQVSNDGENWTTIKDCSFEVKKYFNNIYAQDKLEDILYFGTGHSGIESTSVRSRDDSINELGELGILTVNNKGITTVNARYIRIFNKERVADVSGMSYWELEVYTDSMN